MSNILASEKLNLWLRKTMLARNPTFETVQNFAKVALPVALLGFAGMNLPQDGLNLIGEVGHNLMEGPGQFFVGAFLGGLQNGFLMVSAIDKLQDKARLGTNVGLTVTEDKKNAVAVIRCGDKRIPDDIGGGILLGGFGELGAGLSTLFGAGLLGKFTPDTNPVAQASVGYLAGSNLITEGYALYTLATQIGNIVKHAKIQSGNKNINVKIIIQDHWDGCGASGFTSILSYIAKFYGHNVLHSADVLNGLNEILGYALVNEVISPLVWARYGGKVSLTASLIHSEMQESH